MKPHKRLLPSLLLLSVAFAYLRVRAEPARPGAATGSPLLVSPAKTAGPVLLHYQLALDQLSQGHRTEARVILEQGIRNYGNQPELNLLLGYLLQQEGRPAEARERLAPIAAASPAAAQLALELGQNTPHRLSAASGAEVTDLVATRPVSVASVAQNDARLSRLERLLAGMINDERAAVGHGSLEYDDKLAATARAHSAEMRDLQYFAHDSPTISLHEPLDRFRAAMKSTPAVVAENIYRAWGGRHQITDVDVKEAHTSFMNSPGHRANIMHDRITRVGVGIVANANGDIWVTQMFSRP